MNKEDLFFSALASSMPILLADIFNQMGSTLNPFEQIPWYFVMILCILAFVATFTIAEAKENIQ